MPRYALFSQLLGIIILWSCTPAVFSQQGGAISRIQLELVTARGFPLTGSQQWVAALKDLGLAGIRIRGARPGEREEVEKRGTGRSATFLVRGVLNKRNRLVLPGGTFALHERERLAEWFARVADEGVEGVAADRHAFGLTAKQLVDVHDRLALKVATGTKNERHEKVVRLITQGITLPVVMEASGRQRLTGDDLVADELMGLSSGTALAAALRPLGLAMVPEKPQGRNVRLRIADVREVSEAWPVGWPPDVSPGKLAPKLFEHLDVEIDDVLLTEALDAIQARIGLPVLLDRNAMARHRIDPSQVRVSFPAKRSFYKAIIDRLLYQARLKVDLRVDEAGQAFLWITTLAKPS